MENMTLRGDKVFLRALEAEDIDLLYKVENDEMLWNVSNTIAPYSKYILEQYLENSHRDIFDVKQLRLVICDIEDESAVGLIDLYDFDPQNRKVGVGIVIHNPEQRSKGYASEALKLLCNYSFKYLQVHQIFAGITEDNEKSMGLFEANGFQCNGIKKDWVLSGGKYLNEHIYQLIKS